MQPDFLERLRVLAPDLCVTAAYGNILPQAFLDMPRWGTLNIHPSLLPKYRGAAPVQRQLQVGRSCDALELCILDSAAAGPRACSTVAGATWVPLSAIAACVGAIGAGSMPRRANYDSTDPQSIWLCTCC